MKKLREKVKRIKENDIIRSFFIIIYAIVCLLLFINQYNIQYFANGFSAIDDKKLQVYYFDVGQATATMIVLPNDVTMVIDTGSSDSEKDFMESVNLVLEQNNLETVDYLILTHSDEDHVGGAVALLEKYQIYNVIRPKILSVSSSEVEGESYKVVATQVYEDVITAVYNEPYCQVTFMEDEAMFAGQDTYIRFFACQKDSYSETNDYSPFINIVYKNNSFLFTGDASEDREKELIEYANENDIDVSVDFLLVGHHGSKYSTSSEFLALTNPKFAFISAGDNLHPSYDVIKRLQENGVKEIYCTKTDGMIAVGVDESGNFVIKTMKNMIDLPLIIVLFSCVVFCLIYLFDRYYYKKRRNKYLRNKHLVL